MTVTPAVSTYSTTPANNIAANTGVTWDEGMAPAQVNNSARQNMADLRSYANDLIWFAYGSGTSPVVTPVYVSGTSFKVAGVDVSSVYHVGRRVKAVGSGTGTIYGTISAVAYSTDTTVTMAWDSGTLSNETLTIYISQQQITGLPIGGPIKFPATQISSSDVNVLDDYKEGTWTPIDSSGASLSFTNPQGRYTKIGRLVHVSATLTFPTTANGSATLIGGLPYTSANVGAGFPLTALAAGGGGVAIVGLVNINATTLGLSDGSGVSRTNANNSTLNVYISGSYSV